MTTRSSKSTRPHAKSEPTKADPERKDSLPHDGEGVVRNDKGEEQPADKDRARLVSREDRGDDPPGHRRH